MFNIVSAVTMAALFTVVSTSNPQPATHNPQSAPATDHRHDKLDMPVESEFLPEGEKAPDFILVDQNNKKTALSRFKGKPVFLTFVYTSCAYECPLVLHNRKQIEQGIEETMGEGLVFLAVTVDPVVDTPDVLNNYVKKLHLDPVDLHLLTGDPGDVKRVLKSYKIKVAKVAKTGQVVGHPNMGYVIDRNGLIFKIMLFAF